MERISSVYEITHFLQASICRLVAWKLGSPLSLTYIGLFVGPLRCAQEGSGFGLHIHHFLCVAPPCLLLL